jgi:hypothetical protein
VRKKWLVGLLAIALIHGVGSASPAAANAPLVGGGYSLQTIAYDGFDYPVGGLSGRDGGQGWANAWFRSYTVGGLAQVQAAGISYPGLNTTGGSVVWGSGGNQLNGFSRSFERVAEGSVYIRVLTELGSQTGGGTPTFRFLDESPPAPQQTFAIGNNGGPNMTVLDSNLSPVATSTESMNQLLLTIVRIDYDDSLTRLWVNPDLSVFDYAAPPPADAQAVGFAPTFNRIDPFVRAGAVYDEISVLRLIAPPPPPPPVPASAPVDVVAVAGDRSAVVSWDTPATSGSFPISTYQVQSAPGGHGCVVAAPATSCEVARLANDVAYTFHARALTGAGWSRWSQTSNAVTPKPVEVPSILISGTRGEVRGGSGIVVTGATSGFGMGGIVRPWVRAQGQRSFTQGAREVLVDVKGDFTWQRRGVKTMTVYVEIPDGSVRSNQVTIPTR